MKIKDTIQKRFIAVESDSLTIETIQTESKTHRQSLRVVKLKGTWRANDYNELVFESNLRKGSSETHTFKGIWKLNKNQQIEYTSEDGRDTLTFKGYWQLPSEGRLSYILEGNLVSRFEFKVRLESPTLYPKEGQIRYRIGIGIRQSRQTLPGQLIILYGEWKFGRNLGLIFQMDYGQGKLKAVEFGAEVSFQRNKFSLSLKNTEGKPLGITLTYTFQVFKRLDSQAFIRLKSLQKELGVEAGFSVPF